MPDVTRTVQTIYKVTDMATKPLEGIASAGMSAARSLSNLMSPVVGLVSGLASIGTVKGLIDLNSQAENLQLTIAGTYRAFDAVGEKTSSITKRFKAGTDEWIAAQHKAFGDARAMATDVLAQINKDAAALPGSAEEYAEVYRTALPAALSIGMRDVKAVAKMTDDFAATALANQIDSQQAARDLAMILRGQAGMQVRSWSVLQPLIGKSAQEFNKLTGTKRLDAVQGALLKYKPLLNEFGDTWDAVYGTTEALVKQILRGGSAPLFTEAKKSMQALNGWLENNAEVIQGKMVKGFSALNAVAHKFVDVLGKLKIDKIKDAFSGERIQKMLKVVSMAGVLTGNPLAIAGMLGSKLMGGSDPAAQLQPIVDKLGTVLGEVVDAAAPLIDALGKGLADVAKALAPEMDKMVKAAIELVPAFTKVVEVAARLTVKGIEFSDWLGREVAIGFDNMMDALGDPNDNWHKSEAHANLVANLTEEAIAKGGDKMVERFFELERKSDTGIAGVDGTPGVGDKFASAWGGLMTADISGGIKNANAAIVESANVFNFAKADELQATAEASWKLMELVGGADAAKLALQDMQPAINQLSGAMMAAQSAAALMGGSIGATLGAAARSINPEDLTAAKDGSSRRGGTHVHNDFRFSKFDIKQMFAEGYDPDRIGVAFVSQVTALSNQKLESGVAPMYGTTR